MSIPLQVTGVSAPGFLGLNLTNSAVANKSEWATEANNCVIGEDGRIEARLGWVKKTSSALGSTATYNLDTIHEYIKKTGAVEILAAANNNIYKANVDLTTLSSIYSTSITDDYWKMVSFNDYCFMFQGGQAPLRYDGTNCVLLSSVGSFGDSSDAVIATLKPNECIAAYGRLWLADTSSNKMKIWWSDSLSGHIWNSGTAGALDINSVLTDGTDEVVALAAFNGTLVIFMKTNILIYGGVDTDPTANMALIENIHGVGCIARDSVQSIGTDILFLSKSGVRSLSRTIQEKSMPIGDISKNVKQELDLFLSETPNKVKSLFSQKYGFYLLSFPTGGKTFVFDVRMRLEDGTARCTTWGLVPSSMVVRQNRDILFGMTGVVGQYSGFDDNDTTYTLTYSTPWLDYDKPYNYKILKKFYTLLQIGGTPTITFKWYVDYKDSYNYLQDILEGNTISEYNIAQYNINEYGYGYTIKEAKHSMSRMGKVIKFTIEVPIVDQFRIKQYSLYAKIGREA